MKWPNVSERTTKRNAYLNALHVSSYLQQVNQLCWLLANQCAYIHPCGPYVRTYLKAYIQKQHSCGFQVVFHPNLKLLCKVSEYLFSSKRVSFTTNNNQGCPFNRSCGVVARAKNIVFMSLSIQSCSFFPSATNILIFITTFICHIGLKKKKVNLIYYRTN